MLRFALLELFLIALPFAVWLIWRAGTRSPDGEDVRAMPVGALAVAGAGLAILGAIGLALATSGESYDPSRRADDPAVENGPEVEQRRPQPLPRQERPF